MANIPVRSPTTGEELRVYLSEELSSELSAFDAEYSCPHNNKTVANRVFANGKLHTREICLDCGRDFGGKPKQSNLKVVDVQQLRDQFEDNRQEHRFQIAKRHHTEDTKFSAEWRRDYLRYLASSDWKALREKVLKRANGICEGCGEKPAQHVHHLTYERVRQEMLFDLVAICAECHRICHPEHHDDFYFIFDDLPCLACRWNGEDHCSKFDCPLSLALVDEERCGPKLNGLEGLK